MANLNMPVSFRGQALNTMAVAGGVVTGCSVNSFEDGDVSIGQFTEPLALADGIDAGRTWTRGRRVSLTGTVYGSTRADTLSRLAAISAVMLPVSGTFGLYSLVYYEDAVLALAYRARPEGLRVTSDRHSSGGVDARPLAISWQVDFLVAGSTEPILVPGAVLFTSRYLAPRVAALVDQPGYVFVTHSWTRQTQASTAYDVITVMPSYQNYPLQLTENITDAPNAYKTRRYMTWRAYPDAKFCRLKARLVVAIPSTMTGSVLTWTLRKCAWGAAQPVWDEPGAVVGAGTMTLTGVYPENKDIGVDLTFAVGTEDVQLYFSATISPALGATDQLGPYLAAWWDPVEFGIEQLTGVWG